MHPVWTLGTIASRGACGDTARKIPMKKMRQLMACGAILSSFLVGSHAGLAAPPEIPSATYPVSHLPAATVAGKLQDLLDSSSVKAELIVDRTSNRLVVRGPRKLSGSFAKPSPRSTCRRHRRIRPKPRASNRSRFPRTNWNKSRRHWACATRTINAFGSQPIAVRASC